MLRPASAVADISRAAPTSAPDSIENTPMAPAMAPVVEGLSDVVGAAVGVPGGLSMDPTPVVVLPPDPPASEAPKAYRTGGAIREPRKIQDAAPQYPEIARASRVEGLVILEATIDERGVVTGARVLRSVPLLDAAALAALKQWRYTPTLLNGIPVRVLMTVTFRFSLGDPPMLEGENSGRPAPARSRRSAADRSGGQADRDL
jgi:protein TonB